MCEERAKLALAAERGAERIGNDQSIRVNASSILERLDDGIGAQLAHTTCPMFSYRRLPYTNYRDFTHVLVL